MDERIKVLPVFTDFSMFCNKFVLLPLRTFSFLDNYFSYVFAFCIGSVPSALVCKETRFLVEL